MLHGYEEDIVNSLECGLMVVDLSGMIMLFNQAAGEITGENCRDALFSRADSIKTLRPFAALMGRSLDEPVRRAEIEIDTRSGERRFIGVSTYPLKHSAEVIGVIAVFTDLTESGQGQEKVQESEQPAVEDAPSAWEETFEDQETEESETVLVAVGDSDLESPE